jgi:hypothetical protein
MTRSARSVAVPISPGILSRHCFGIRWGGAQAAHKTVGAPSKLIRVLPSTANGMRRSSGANGANGAKNHFERKEHLARSAVGLLLHGEATVASIRTLTALDQHRNQTSATCISSFPRIFALGHSAPLLSELPVVCIRYPPTKPLALPTSTKMASESASASLSGIKITAAPVPTDSLKQSPPPASFSKALSSLVSTRVQRPAQFLSRPVQNTGTATGTTTPTLNAKRTMVSITPHSVNRTSLHPHGVQYVFSATPSCSELARALSSFTSTFMWC